MTLLWFDGFESYANATDFDLMVDPNHYGYGVLFDAAYGRNGNGLKVNANFNYADIPLLSAPSSDTCIIGFALYINSSDDPVYNASYPIIQMRDGSGNIHLKFHVNSSRNIEVRDNSNVLLGTTSGQVIAATTWYYIEIKAIISDSVGQVIIKIDEVTRLTTSADKDTLNGSNAYVQHIRIYAVYSMGLTWYDDFYWLDGSGTKNNDFLGDVRVDVCRVTGVGNTTQFAPSAGSNYENVDETPGPDGDTTYNDGDLAEKDIYELANLSALGTTIHGTKSQATKKKTDASSRKSKIVTRSNITDYLSSEFVLSDSYQTFTKIYEDNPDDAAAWEEADINGAEVGIVVSA